MNLNAQLRDIEQTVDRLIQKGQLFMALIDDFRAKLAEADAETNRISARITELIGQLQSGNLNDAQEAEAFAGLSGLADKLKTVGQV